MGVKIKNAKIKNSNDLKAGSMAGFILSKLPPPESKKAEKIEPLWMLSKVHK